MRKLSGGEGTSIFNLEDVIINNLEIGKQSFIEYLQILEKLHEGILSPEYFSDVAFVISHHLQMFEKLLDQTYKEAKERDFTETERENAKHFMFAIQICSKLFRREYDMLGQEVASGIFEFHIEFIKGAIKNIESTIKQSS